MKFFYIFILLFFSLAIKAQKTYVFDYCSVYEYKQDEFDTKNTLELTYSNSEDNNYALFFIARDSIVSNYVKLYDYRSSRLYTYNIKQPFHLNKIMDIAGMFKEAQVVKLIYPKCKKSKKVNYELTNFTINTYNGFSIKVFEEENKDYSCEFFYHTQPSRVIKNPYYNENLRCLLDSCKIRLENNEVISYSYMTERGSTERKDIRTLLGLHKTTKITFTIH